MGQRLLRVADDAGGDVTPQQYNDIVRRPNQREPEVRLMQALLEDAIECLFFRGVTAGCQRENMQQDAVIWLRGGREAPFSFDRVCEVLGMDAEALRAELFRRLQLVRRGGDCAPRTMHRPAVNGRQTRIVATRVRPGMAPTA